MKVLYIDKACSIDEIRIGEQKFFTELLPSYDVDTHLLLLGNGDNGYFKDNLTIHRRKNFNIYKNIISFDPVVVVLKLINLNKKYNFDVLVVRKSLTISLALILVSQFINTKFVYMMSFPKWEMIRLKKQKYKLGVFIDLVSNLYEKSIKFVLKKSDLVIAKTKYFYNDFSKKHKIKKKNWTTYPMGFDNNLIPHEKSKIGLRIRHNLPIDKPILIYFGSIDDERNPEFILQIFKKVVNSNSSVFGLIIGGNESQKNRLIDNLRGEGLQNKIKILSAIPRNVLFEYIYSSDMSISPIPPLSVYKISSPTKAIESMGLGVPVICNREIYEQVEVIEESEGGVLVDYNIDSFAEAVLAVISDDEKLVLLKSNAAAYIQEYRLYETMGRKLYNELLKLTK